MTRSAMHPLLGIHALASLSSPARHQAVKAASGSRDAWNGLYAKLQKMDADTLQKYLPVVHDNLDPARIPDDQALEGRCMRSTHWHIKPAYESLRILLRVEQIPEVAALDLWSHAWQWIEFMEAHATSTSLEVGSPITEVFATLLFCLSYFGARCNVDTLYKAAPSLHGVFARIWMALTSMPNNRWGCHSTDGLCFVLAYYYSDCDSVDQLIDNFESLGTFGSIVLKHLSQVIEGCADTATASKVNAHAHMAKHLAERASGARVLAETGGVPILIRALHAASTKFLDLFEGENTIYDILSCLVLIFSSRPFYPDVAVAFENNLIPAIMACARSQRMRPLSRDALNQLKLLLTRTLPAAMVYSSVVRALAQGEKAMLSTADYWEPIGTDELLGTPLHEEYKGIMVLLATRLCDYDKFRSGAHSELRACDNHLCNIIQPTAKFKRCSMASKRTSHTMHPIITYSPKFPGSSDTLLHKRDDRFLRLIIQQHYMCSSFELLQQQLAYIRETRRTDFVLEFIYTEVFPTST
ncbi:MYND-type domain-containing protein [Mycena indigotica]|uniref:MYND-type domain-containing protein n=1 Tax=Mycena indigotica TaxID=2126181 RepID=A0A8H6RYV4_9AGAR|nr:MYND-type domain-containing protein [Mycena indigotica]KAF7288881.1 MYND-type domain-containing protein [Mycena indigotica]